MSNMSVHYSTNSNEWTTPQEFYERLDSEFNFNLDPCTNGYNAKCERYFTEEEDGLIQDWSDSTVFMNPPYGRAIKDWIRKAYEESRKGATVVALIPSRTDTRYWHEYVMKSKEIRLVKGRIKFGDGRNSAPFPSAVVVFDTHTYDYPILSAMESIL